jgi:dolichyl-phosphate beta-glucosyltransferase
MNMAEFLEMGQNLLWTVYESAKATPLPVLLLLLVTTAVSTLTFVRPSQQPTTLRTFS